MNGSLFKGFGYMLQGFHILLQPGFRLFLLVPFLVNIVLFSLMILWAYSLFDGWMVSLLSWLPDWLSFLEWLFWGVYVLLIVMTLFYGFISVANLLAAPFYGYLAELTEQNLTGEGATDTFSWKTLVTLIPRTVMRELQKILYYLPRVLGLFILGLIPGVNLIAAFIWILFSAWMMAIQYIDYPADNHQLSFKEMRRYLSQYRFTSVGFGLLVFGFTLLPLINFIAMPAAVCGAVVFWVKEPRSLGKINLNFEHTEQGKLN